MKSLLKIITATAICLSFAACNSIPTIPEDATATQLIQMGQDALEIPNYKAAETYYNAVIQRYGMDIATYIEASYELGHMYMKQKKYEQAYQKFDEIIATFENGEIGVIPAAFNKLAKMGMEEIPAKYKNK